MRRSTFLASLFACCLFAPLRVDAGDREVTSRDVAGVVELFTSQGCASCPPADGVLATLSADPGIVTLAYHVDYWDYIGWEDTHGSRDNTERQQAYAEALNSGSVYTPQAVVNGRRDVPGAAEPAIRAAIGETALDAKGLERPLIRLTRKGDRLHISVEGPPTPAGRRPPVLMLVTYDRWSETAVDRGENEGKTLVSANAVRNWRILGMWENQPLGIDIPLSMLDKGDEPVGCAAILQDVTEKGGPGPIIAAAAMTP